MQSKWLSYLFVLFVFNTILFAIKGIGQFSEMLFLSLSVLTCFIIILSPRLIKKVLLDKKFTPFLFFNIINFVYHLLFELADFDSLKYLLARFTVFSLISFHIAINPKYLKEFFFKHLYFFLLILSLASIILLPFGFSNRYFGIFTNPNALGSIMLIAFSIKIILFYKGEKRDFLYLTSFFLLILLSGSRVSMLGVALALLFRFGISFRSISLYFFVVLGVYFISDFLGTGSSTSRLVSADIISNRVLEFKYAYETFQSKWLTGYGLSHYAYIDQSLIGVEHEHLHIGAHNGYLAVMVQYGLIFATTFFIFLFKYLFSIFKYVRHHWQNNKVKFLSFIILFTLINGFVETMMTGINDFQTCLFWLSFGYLYSQAYQWRKSLK